MKLPVALIIALASLAVNTLADTEATATAVLDDSSFAALESREGWRDIFPRLRVGVKGLPHSPTSADVSFLIEAMKFAYNEVHAPLDDDFNFIDFNLTAMEVEIDDDEALFKDVAILKRPKAFLSGKSKYKGRGVKISAYGAGDFSCRLCGRRAEALDFAPDEASDSSMMLGKPEPLANIKDVQERLCKILKEQGPNGSKGVFGAAHGCKIFQIESLGSWDLMSLAPDTAEELVAKAAQEPAQGDSVLSIVLTGLTCEDDLAPCHDDDLLRLLSDGLVTAHNKVNFDHDLFIEAFDPTSFELYRSEGTPVTSVLRGTADSTEILPVGHWHGNVRVRCRACDKERGKDKDPVMAHFLKLKQVERVFCELISGHSIATTNLVQCSLAFVQDVEILPDVMLADLDEY